MRSKNRTPKAEPLASGHVAIMLDGEEIVLKPSYRVMNLVSRQYGGLLEARNRLAAESVDAIAFVIRIGSGMNERDARDLHERIYETGVVGELVVPLIDFVVYLGNGGRRLGDNDGSDRSGHAEADHEQESL